jgi:hypothetical protein
MGTEGSFPVVKLQWRECGNGPPASEDRRKQRDNFFCICTIPRVSD